MARKFKNVSLWFFYAFCFWRENSNMSFGFFCDFLTGNPDSFSKQGKMSRCSQAYCSWSETTFSFYGLVLYSQLLSSSFFLCPYHFRRIRDMNNAIKDDNEIRFSLVKKRFSWLITWSHPWRYVIIFQNSTMSKTGFHTVWKSLKMSRDKSNFGHFSRENLTLSRCLKITQNVVFSDFFY